MSSNSETKITPLSSPTSATVPITSFQVVDATLVSPELICGSCSLLARDAVTHSIAACRNLLCKSCAIPSTPCAHCQTKLESNYIVSAPLAIINHINGIDVKCNTCSSTLNYGRWPAHYDTECMVACPRSCGVTLTRAMLPAHISTCTNAPVPCLASSLGCTVMISRSSIDEEIAHASACIYRQAMPALRAQRDEIVRMQDSIRSLERTNAEQRSIYSMLSLCLSSICLLYFLTVTHFVENRP
jgi:hypothetical protein